eukprot:CAMPEP_0181311516 /NCGR_PEP_ID=MMETSP1101-20121128/13180_1 /TAXON_ID=46948 /ORGANISM="Rhodomonas abbreviata, Strain Caron Lab Isolate" /LENGTH=500 /DNA_ID=CAMNT_0023418255 /DNA_START=167 /DNA_END=1665 /DNA_ORIENTATION=-
MGNQLATRLHVDFMSELPKVDKDGEGIVFGRILGGGRFLKSLQCWHRGNMVVVKAYSKREINESLREYGERLETIRDKLNSVQHPNILPFTWFPDTQRAAFLVRGYVQSSLKERITSRPLLTVVEKRWFTFQLLTALHQCESAGLVHGDVKTNNILVTSNNWVVLSDLTGLKPALLPEDNPADLSYFFDDDYHKRCYVAPERFYHSSSPLSERPSGHTNAGMDLFSAGCVIAELFLDGEAVMTLSQLLAYRKGEHDPAPKLAEISDPNVRELISQLMSLKPEGRGAAAEHLQAYQGTVFPRYFQGFLHAFAWRCISQLSPDECVATIAQYKPTILSELAIHPSRDPNDPLSPPSDDLVNVLVLVTSCIRAVVSPESKLQAVHLLAWGGGLVLDSIVLDRTLPYLAALISDEHESSLVRARAISAMAHLLSLVQAFPLSDHHLFLHYVLPTLSACCSEKDEVAFVAYAAALGSLAETAQRFLDTAAAVKHRDLQANKVAAA